MCDVIDALRVDVAMFNEFVDGESRSGLRGRLRSLGLEHIVTSTRFARSNQVFIASRYPLAPGDLRSPMSTSVAPANWYHVRIPSHGVELIHLRMPWWNRASRRSAYRQELAAILHPAMSRPLAVCGDFNYDPFKRAPADATAVQWLGLESMLVTRPTGDWSFINKKGTATSRVDHVANTRAVAVDDVRYETTWGQVRLAGAHVPISAQQADRPISDHAPLLFSLRPA